MNAYEPRKKKKVDCMCHKMWQGQTLMFSNAQMLGNGSRASVRNWLPVSVGLDKGEGLRSDPSRLFQPRDNDQKAPTYLWPPFIWKDTVTGTYITCTSKNNGYNQQKIYTAIFHSTSLLEEETTSKS